MVAIHFAGVDGEPEGGAFAAFTFDGDGAAHLFDQALTDHQAEAGAAVFAGGGVVGLAKGVEQALLLVWVKSNPCVSDTDTQHGVLQGFAL